MKRFLILIGFLALTLTFSLNPATAYTVTDLSNTLNSSNITVYDGFSNSSTGWYGQQELNEVEPGSAALDSFDLEAMFYDSTLSTLGLVGNYWFEHGVTVDDTTDTFTGGDNNLIESGDIFITTDDYQYVLDLDFSTYDLNSPSTHGAYTYDVYQFDLTDSIPTSPTTTVGASGPWRLNTDPQTNQTNQTNLTNYLLNGYTDQTLGYFSSDDPGPSPLDGLFGTPNHEAMLVNLGFLNGAAFNARYTMECGNDVLAGQYPIPEPATLFSFGLGLLGMCGVIRKKIKTA